MTKKNSINCRPDVLKDNADGVLATAAFALWALQSPAKLVADDEEEFHQLQSGCIEFLAGCLQATIGSVAKERQGPLIEELGDFPEKGSNHTADSYTTHGKAMKAIHQTLRDILSSSQCHHLWITRGLQRFKEESCDPWIVQPSMLICVWNSFLMVSQRCETRHLDTWARRTAPWVVDWGCQRLKSGEYHALCMAAALQIVFVLVTRTKQLDHLRTAGGSSTTSQNIVATYRWSLRCIKHASSSNRQGSQLRLAAMKLLLALVTIDQIGDCSGHLGPGELREAVSTISAAANIDSDPDVRSLAGHLVSALS